MLAVLPRDTTLRVAIANAVFCFVTAAVYVVAGVEPSRSVAAFLVFGPPILTLLWLQKDARRTHVGPVQDWGFFMWQAWPILAPWYAFKSRGRGGWRFLVGMALLAAPAYVAMTVLAILFSVFGIERGVSFIVP
jgi:hypothetical protein